MTKVIALAVALLLTNAARAHDFWIEPSAFKPPAGSIVSVRLFAGQDFAGDPLPRQASSIDKFFLRQAGADTDIGGANHIDPAGLFRMPGAGAAVIGYSSNGRSTELPAARFEDYLRQHGLIAVIEDRLRRGEKVKPGRERFYRYAKALLAGSTNAAAATQPLGFVYEIVPGNDPTVLAGPLRGRILYQGKPLAGALVEALWRDDPSIRLSTRSDTLGGFDFALPRPGVWLVKSVHMVRAGFFASADWDSLWASLTFEVPKP